MRKRVAQGPESFAVKDGEGLGHQQRTAAPLQGDEQAVGGEVSGETTGRKGRSRGCGCGLAVGRFANSEKMMSRESKGPATSPPMAVGPQVHPGFPSSSHLQVSPGVQPGVPAVWSACRDPPLDAHWRWGADRIPCAVPPPPPKSTALVISLWPRSYHSSMLTFWQMAAFFRWLSKFSLDGLQLCNDSQKQWLSGMWGQICLSRIGTCGQTSGKVASPPGGTNTFML